MTACANTGCDNPTPPDDGWTMCLKCWDQMGLQRYKQLGREIGELVAQKQVQYGDSVGKSAAMLQTLYPHGIPVHAYGDALLVVRVLDKLSRIAQRGADGQDLGGEDAYLDIAGYGILGAVKDTGGREG